MYFRSDNYGDVIPIKSSRILVERQAYHVNASGNDLSVYVTHQDILLICNTRQTRIYYTTTRSLAH